jgi:ferric-dicitrate binding protein FerR (iron transport regulator)
MSGVDVDQVVAWKNGMFYFENADIGTVMRQLSRWYDVDVVYQSNNIKHLFVGKMPRSSKLSDVLKVLELTSTINFEIEGRKIIVKP